jgi:hypothetical protein
MYMFNNETGPVLPGSDGLWLDVDDSAQIDEAMRILRRTPPENGTNMKAAFEVVASLNPMPDNVILLVDGLPTMDAPTTTQRTVSGRERRRLYEQAARELPPSVPINVLLYPMEGDYDAAISFWSLAYRSGGSFMSVSKDWP